MPICAYIIRFVYRYKRQVSICENGHGNGNENGNGSGTHTAAVFKAVDEMPLGVRVRAMVVRRYRGPSGRQIGREERCREERGVVWKGEEKVGWV